MGAIFYCVRCVVHLFSCSRFSSFAQHHDLALGPDILEGARPLAVEHAEQVAEAEGRRSRAGSVPG